jgi:hypothetical protein
MYRWRAGVEATMSQYNALTGVKRLRVRGLQAVRYCAILKAAGLNMFRAAAVTMARSPSPKGQSGNKASYYAPLASFKERIYAFIARSGQFSLPRRIATESECRLAA